MLKKELIEENKELKENNNDLRQELEVVCEEKNDLKKRLGSADSAVARHREHRIYLEGQVDVFKRLVGTHPEQIPTRKEYKETPYNQEILSSQELPF
jgi:regulator of replication initiation timing